jgi:hypothetical protein
MFPVDSGGKFFMKKFVLALNAFIFAIYLRMGGMLSSSSSPSLMAFPESSRFLGLFSPLPKNYSFSSFSQVSPSMLGFSGGLASFIYIII